MNTYAAHDITDVPAGYKLEALAFAEEAIEQGLMISVQLQDLQWGDDTLTDVYGMYSLTEEEVCDYYNSGGMWYYYNPTDFLSK